MNERTAREKQGRAKQLDGWGGGGRDWQRTVIGVKIIPASKDLGDNHGMVMRQDTCRRVVMGIEGDRSIYMATHQGENTKGVGEAAHDLKTHKKEKRSRESAAYFMKAGNVPAGSEKNSTVHVELEDPR